MWLACDACGNHEKLAATCKVCGGRGRVRVEGCVKKQIKPGAWDLLEMCGYTDDGTWPIAGGILDQTPAFLRAYRWVRGEKAAVEAELMKEK